MKPLIREFLYDKLRRSLYKHELKTKVWNNPYFPFYTKEEYDDIADWFTRSDRSEYDDLLIKCRQYFKENKISEYIEYEEFIRKLDHYKDPDNIIQYIVYNNYCNYSIIKDIEDKYG